MRKLLAPIVGLMLVIAAGCKGTPSSTAASNGTTANVEQSSSASMSPEDLGALAAQIKKQPNDADKLLADHGLNEQSFAAAVRKVSENPTDAKRYTSAYKSAS